VAALGIATEEELVGEPDAVGGGPGVGGAEEVDGCRGFRAGVVVGVESGRVPEAEEVGKNAGVADAGEPGTR